jgi:hypothetical protein
MIRNLKVLGLALVAAFAMSAMAAASAQAVGHFTSDGPVILKGTDEAGGENYFEYPGVGKVQCPGSSYVGERNGGGFIENSPIVSTITPAYHNETCVGPNGTQKATITMNGCDYLVELGETTEGVKDEFGATVEIVCPANKVIEIHVYVGTTEAAQACLVKVGAQGGITGLDVANELAGEETLDTLTITGKTTNIKGSKSGACGTDSKNLTYKATITVEGLNKAEEKTPIEVTD